MNKVSFFIIVLVLGCLTACSPRIVERVKTDTIYVSKTDTVATTVTVEREPSWTASWRAKVVIVALILLLFFLASKRHE